MPTLDEIAQIARDTFHRGNKITTDWDDLPERIRRIWRDVARAVLAAELADTEQVSA